MIVPGHGGAAGRGAGRAPVGALGLILALLPIAAGVGCDRPPPPTPINAVQDAFRDGDLNAREAHGRRVFEQQCATCHGPEGRGDGQNAYNLQPPPPEFQGSLGRLSAEDRRAVIEGGTAAIARSPLCPPRGRSLGEDEVEALLAYLEVMARQPTEESASSAGGGRWRRPR